MAKDNKEVKAQAEEKKSDVKSGSKCSCGCIPSVKTK